MSIGSSINYSIAAAGTTVSALTKTSQGHFQELISHTNGGNTPIELTLRAVDVGALTRNLGLTFKFNPTVLDAPDDQSSGRITVSLVVSGRIGSVITETAYKNHILYALSVLTDSNILDALATGSLE